VEITEVLMTPADASKLLEHNSINRLMLPARVNAIADAINRGGWLDDANPIKVDEDGVLVDGQHRLQAIVKTGKAVKVILVTGVPFLARMTVDTNRHRSFADWLRQNGVAASGDTAATTRLLWRYRVSGIDRREIADTATLWAFYQANKAVIDEGVSRGRGTGYYVRTVPRSVMSVAWVILSEVDYEDAHLFWAQILATRKPSSAVTALCTYGSSAPRSVAGGRYEQRYGLAIVIKAWNAHRRGAEVGHLSWKPGANEKFPEPK
jgi:hypothetical protein